MAQWSLAETTPGLHRAIHPGPQLDVSAAIEDPHHIAIDDRRARASAALISSNPASSISWTTGKLQNVVFRKLSALRARSSRGNCLASRTVPRFVRRGKCSNRIEPLRLKILAVKLSLATLRPEIPFRERQEI